MKRIVFVLSEMLRNVDGEPALLKKPMAFATQEAAVAGKTGYIIGAGI